MSIEVIYIPQEDVLGTQDGITYTVYPTDTGHFCEPQTRACFVCVGKFTEAH